MEEMKLLPSLGFLETTRVDSSFIRYAKSMCLAAAHRGEGRFGPILP